VCGMRRTQEVDITVTFLTMQIGMLPVSCLGMDCLHVAKFTSCVICNVRHLQRGQDAEFQ
jgi:hypothetical protein